MQGRRKRRSSMGRDVKHRTASCVAADAARLHVVSRASRQACSAENCNALSVASLLRRSAPPLHTHTGTRTASQLCATLAPPSAPSVFFSAPQARCGEEVAARDSSQLRLSSTVSSQPSQAYLKRGQTKEKRCAEGVGEGANAAMTHTRRLDARLNRAHSRCFLLGHGCSAPSRSFDGACSDWARCTSADTQTHAHPAHRAFKPSST